MTLPDEIRQQARNAAWDLWGERAYAAAHSATPTVLSSGEVIDTILDPGQYAVWHIPVVSGRKPG